MQDFRKLSVWQLGRQLTKAVYEVRANYPRDELFGLTTQMRRAAISICSNIAEGCGRGSDPDFRRFLYASMGSVCELESETILSLDLGFLTKPPHDRVLERVTELKRMLSGLIKSVSRSKRPGEN